MTVFISYSHTDKAFVKRLVEDLRTKTNNIVVQYDADFTPGDQIPTKVAETIAGATVFIPVISPNSVRDSKWCSNELDNWLTRTLDKECPSGIYKTIPVVIAKDCKLPEQIAHIISIDFYTDYESGLFKLIEAINKIAGEMRDASPSLKDPPPLILKFMFITIRNLNIPSKKIAPIYLGNWNRMMAISSIIVIFT